MADKVQIDIVTTADTSGVDKTKKALSGLKDTIEQEVDSVKQLQDEFAARFRQQEADIANIGKNPLPSPTSVPGAAVEANLPAVNSGANTAAAGILAVALATSKMLSELSNGAKRASEMAQSLEGLDDAARAAALNGMGDLGPYIGENSELLARFASETGAAARKMDELWTAAGSRVIPALSATSEAIASVNTAGLGAGLGDVIGGAVVYFNDLSQSAKGLGQSFFGSSEAAGGFLANFLRFQPAFALQTRAVERLVEANRNYIASQKDSALSESQFLEVLERGTRLQKQLADAAQSRADAELPAADQIAKLQERKNEAQQKALTLPGKPGAQAAAEVLAIDAQIAALNKKIEAEKEADDQKRQAQAAANEDFELRLKLQEATNAGEQETVNLLKEAIAYRAALKSTGGDVGLAGRAAQAERDAQKERSQKEAEIADKKQRATDEISKKNAEAYEKQQAVLQAKREELELETAINEAKALGNEGEVAKLEWLKQYNSLLAQKDSSGKQIYSEDEARRAANATSAARSKGPEATPSHYVKPGDIEPGTNYRRGRSESDSSFAMSQADRRGGSLLDAYNATRDLPVGSQGGKDPTQATGSKGAEDVKSAAESISKLNGELSAAASALAAAGNSLSGEGLAEIKKAVASLTAKVEALSKKI